MRARRHSPTISIKLRRFKGVLIRLISIFLISACFLPVPAPALARAGGGSAEGATSDSNQNTAPSRLVTRPRQELLPKQSMDKLSPSTKELADRLELTEQLQLLYNPKSGLGKEEKMIVRMKVLETLLEAYFDAASLQGEANREIGRLNSQLEIMSSKRDRAVNLNNAANFILSGTLNTIGSILGFSASMPPLSGNLNQMLSGVVATGMSSYALKQNSGGRTESKEHPTVLAELFGRPVNAQTRYPESVWRFFHSRAPGETQYTRAQLLENHWIAVKHLEPIGSAREKLKLDIVCGVNVGKQISIDDLNDSIAMISDVSNVAALMTHHIRDLMRIIDTDLILSDQNYSPTKSTLPDKEPENADQMRGTPDIPAPTLQ